MPEEIKQRWIRDLVPGRTFADIGGLGGRAMNEMVTTALTANASSAALVDCQPLGDSLWDDFDQRCAARGVTGYEKIIADLNDPGRIGPWELIHCSGIIYHLPEPLRAIQNLRELCQEYLILTSMIVPDTIEGAAGTLDLRGGRAVFLPAIDETARRVCAEYFDKIGIKLSGINMALEPAWLTPHGTLNYSPWWWLFPVDYVDRLLTLAGFKVLLRQETAPSAFSFLCIKP